MFICQNLCLQYRSTVLDFESGSKVPLLNITYFRVERLLTPSSFYLTLNPDPKY